MGYWCEQDILDKDGLKSVVYRFSPDYIIYMAARTDLNSNNINNYSANTEGALILLRL